MTDLERAVRDQAKELERQKDRIEQLQESVQLLLDFAGQINAERERSFSLLKPALGLNPQHVPRPLRVPRRYLAAVPPTPAPLISIVTPTLNQGPFIERTVRSVLGQGYPNVEYVVQDGGSTDGTLDVLDRYSERLTRVVSEPDAGQADAINRGFAVTGGEIMAYLNSDDLLLPGALAFVARFFATHPKVDAVYGHRILIDQDDQDIGMWFLPPHRNWVVTIQDFVPQETLFWRRRAWAKVGGRLDPRLSYAMDWDLLLSLVSSGHTLVRLPRFLGAFRVHPDQKTVTSTKAALAEAAELRERYHGRQVSPGEMERRLRPFFARQKLAHLQQTAVDRLPLSRIEVPA